MSEHTSMTTRGRKIEADEATIRRLWATDLPNDKLAEALGVPRGWLETIRLRHGLPVRKHSAPRGNAAHKPDPTEDEIEERAAIIRSEWSRAEAERRWQLGHLRCEIRRYEFDGRDFAFSHMDG